MLNFAKNIAVFLGCIELFGTSVLALPETLNESVKSIRTESHLWLSGSTAIDTWFLLDPRSPHQPFRVNDPEIGNQANPSPQVHSDHERIQTQLFSIETQLRAGQIRSHRQLNVLLQEVFPSSLVSPSPNQVNVPPPVDCRWGTEDLMSPDGQSRIGYLDFIFPPKIVNSAPINPVLTTRRAVITCPHIWDVGGSFSNFRALAWTDGIPVFGFRLDIEAALKRGWIKDRGHTTIPSHAWDTLLGLSQGRIQNLCAEEGITITAITAAGFSLGAMNAVQLAEAWPELVDSGVSIGSVARPQDAAERAPWLTVQAYGDGPLQKIALADFFATRSSDDGETGVFSYNDFTLHTGPEFRFKELSWSWRHFDSPLQNALARSFVRTLPLNRKVTPCDGSELSRQATDLASFTPQIEAIRASPSSSTSSEADASPIIAAAITPSQTPRGVVISLPSEDGTSADDTALVELCWWGDKGWAGIVAPAATAASLDDVLAWVNTHPAWAPLPCYLVLHEANLNNSELWPSALEYAKAGRVRSLGWIANTDLVYQTPEAAIRWCGPAEPSSVNSESHLFVSDGVSLEPSDLRPKRASFPVVLAANQVPLRPSEESARLALFRIFRLNALQAQGQMLGAETN